MSEIKEESRRRTLFKIIIISVAAIVFVPVLYSGIYLYAFWDPYGRFNNVPIAFVNQDKPYTKDGKVYNLGKEVEDNLRKNTSVGWRFVNYDEAKRGVKGTDYYAFILIPEDFSKKILESTGNKSIKPTIIYEANKGKNFVFAQVSQRAAESIKSEIASNIQDQVTKTLAGGLYNVKNSLADASNGAKDLYNGTIKLSNGSKQLNSGLTTAANGSKQLHDGLRTAASGESQLSTGIDSLIGGLNTFKSSLKQNTSDVSRLVTGTKALSDGTAALASQVSKSGLSKGLTDAADSVGQIQDTLGQVSSILSSSNNQQSVDQARGIIDQLVSTINNQNLEGRLRTASGSAGDLTTNLNKLSPLAQQVAGGTSKLAGTISSTQEKAAAGVNQLIIGVNKLKSGSQDIQSGLNTAVQKTGQLSSGLTALNSGASDLNKGINAVNQGSLKLSDGLSSGYNTISNNLKFNVEEISNFVTNPLTLSDVSINTVKSYGEGLAPYFISLSLWLGAMLMNLIVSLVKLSKVVRYKFIKTYTGTFIVGSGLVTLQALVLSVVLIYGLGLQPASAFLFYIGNIFISIVFFSIMYGVSYAIGIVGTPIVFILFILQLASSGGTFPIETAPRFFRVISPFFPMTYSVEGLRMVTTGINVPRFSVISLVLLIFLLIFYIGGYVFNRVFKGLKAIKAEAE